MQVRFIITLLSLLLATNRCGPGLYLGEPLASEVPASAVLVLTLTPTWQRLDATWPSTSPGGGYLLVRNTGSAVSWVPTTGQVYTAGQTVGGTHLVVLSGTGTSAVESPLINGTTYYYRIFSYNAAYQYTAGAVGTGVPGITCPTGYLAVGPNTDVLVNNAFCVAKYEMKNDGSDNAVSQAAGLPWVSISRNDGGGTPVGPGAITRCQNLGTGYDLISNTQWQAVAREIELAQTAGNYLNWSNGSLTGANAINRGHSDTGPNNALADSLDTDPCFGTGNASCADNTNAHFTQKRTHTLSSGEAIWDLAGNVWEWVKIDIAGGPPYEGGNARISQQPWTADLNHPEMWGPLGNYVSKNSGEFGGLGYGHLGASDGAAVRGGNWWNVVTVSGVFSSVLAIGPLISDVDVGFRCVFVP